MKLIITLESETEKEDRFILKKQKDGININIKNFLFGCSGVIGDAFFDELQRTKWRDEYPAIAYAKLCSALDVVREAMTFICPNDKIKLTASISAPLDKYEKEATGDAEK